MRSARALRPHRFRARFLRSCPILSVLFNYRTARIRYVLQALEQYIPRDSIIESDHVDTRRQTPSFHNVIAVRRRCYPAHAADAVVQTAADPEPVVGKFVQESEKSR